MKFLKSPMLILGIAQLTLISFCVDASENMSLNTGTPNEVEQTINVNDIVGGFIDFADFYALMPPDNKLSIPGGGDISFPKDGPSGIAGNISRKNDHEFNLHQIGVYEVYFNLSVNEACKLVLTLDSGNGAKELEYTMVERKINSQATGIALVKTTTANSILSLRNSSENNPITLASYAGGNLPVAANLIIKQIK